MTKRNVYVCVYIMNEYKWWIRYACVAMVREKKKRWRCKKKIKNITAKKNRWNWIRCTRDRRCVWNKSCVHSHVSPLYRSNSPINAIYPFITFLFNSFFIVFFNYKEVTKNNNFMISFYSLSRSLSHLALIFFFFVAFFITLYYII